jgi:hypothetical protein
MFVVIRGGGTVSLYTLDLSLSSTVKMLAKKRKSAIKDDLYRKYIYIL